MKAIILAAGKGNRLLPLTQNIPKPLIPINGLPIIDRIFMSLPDEIDEVIIVVEYLKEKIKKHVGEFFYGHKVSYVDQIDIRGTFGALISAKNLVTENERFLVLNGDDIHNKTELEIYLKYPRAFGLQQMKMPGYYNIHTDADGCIESFEPQTPDEETSGVLVATGAYVIDSNIFKSPGIALRDGEYGLPQTLMSQKNEYPLHAVITKQWIPINSFPDLENAEKILKNDK